MANKDASYGSCQLLRKFVRLLVLTLISPTEMLLSHPSYKAVGEVVAGERRPIPMIYQTWPSVSVAGSFLILNLLRTPK